MLARCCLATNDSRTASDSSHPLTVTTMGQKSRRLRPPLLSASRCTVAAAISDNGSASTDK
jgi:hypothetical protein